MAILKRSVAGRKVYSRQAFVAFNLISLCAFVVLSSAFQLPVPSQKTRQCLSETFPCSRRLVALSVAEYFHTQFVLSDAPRVLWGCRPLNMSESGDDDEGGVHPLDVAGKTLIVASSKSLGMLFYNIGGMDHKSVQDHLRIAGEHLVEAGNAWERDWAEATMCVGRGADVFYDIADVFGSANIDDSASLAGLFEAVGQELEDISNIVGCTSVGPPSSVPNLLAIRDHLDTVAGILEENSVANTDDHEMTTHFTEISRAFEVLALRN